MTLLHTTFLSFIVTATKMLSSLAINKAIAIYIGPSGLALIGQLQNFIQLTMTTAQGGINTGVTKYISEYGEDKAKVPIFLSTAIKISLTSSILVGVFIISLSEQVSLFLFKTGKFNHIFFIFGFSIILFVINSLLLSILNGLKEIRIYTYIQVVQNIYSLIFTTLLIVFFGIDGAFISLATNQSITLFIALWKLRNHHAIKLENFKQKFSNAEAKKLMGFSLMALTTAVTVPVSHLLIRDHIGTSIGWDEAGYWQATWYISNTYLMLITTTLSVYYLPKLSEITCRKKLKTEISRGYKFIFPIALFSSITIYFSRDMIISLLFSESFAPMSELFLWQLIGDVLKILGWISGILLASKAMIKTHMFTQVMFSLLFVFLSKICLSHYGLIGVSYAYAINYLIFLIYIYIISRRYILGNHK